MKTDKTLETVASEYVEISAQIKALTDQKNRCKAVLEGSGCDKISTPTHALTLTPVESKRLDMRAVKDNWLTSIIWAFLKSLKSQVSTSVRITVKEIK